MRMKTKNIHYLPKSHMLCLHSWRAESEQWIPLVDFWGGSFLSDSKDGLRGNEFEAGTEFPLCSLSISTFVILVVSKRCALGSLVFPSWVLIMT